MPVGVTAGPDGAVWFTDITSSGNFIGRITATTQNPQITEYQLSAGYGAFYITTGPDGALLFTVSFLYNGEIEASERGKYADGKSRTR